MSVAQLVQTSRILELRRACAAALSRIFPDVAVQEHIGKLDISDVLSGEFVNAPAILVAATKVRSEDRLSHDRDLPVTLTAYVVAEDAALGNPPMRFARDEIGYAIGDAVLAALRTEALARWGLSDIGWPDEPTLAPLFTMKTFERGTAIYAVSWTQTLYRCHEPYLDMESGLGDVTVLYPGDPDPVGAQP